MASWLQHRWLGIYLLGMALCALSLFLYGFFPIKYHTGHMSSMNDLPNFVEGVSVDGQEVYNSGHNSVILMVIDGLRYDFATEEYMPFTGELLRNKSACKYVSVAEPPTVTMPRIKAMMTGSVSTFADVALNFGAPAVVGDSVLRAAAARGRLSVMYGDDTWLRLFPGMWSDADGTTSFYVTDYTEVDNNVTRHLDKVLKPKDNEPTFDFLVLHYLGLDHIGHLEGARSRKIKPKLIEMDEVVKKIYTAMRTWDQSAVLFICGDHGMRDAGGHGGATPAEVLVPLVVAKTGGFECPHPLGHGPTVAQVDLAGTIAWLLNAPIPGDSTGRPLPCLLPQDMRQHLYLLHYFAKHNAKAVQRQIGEGAVEKEFYKQFERAQKQFAQFLSTGQESAAKIAKEFYDESLLIMSKYLNESTVEFDLFAIVTAVVLLYAILAALVCVTLLSLQGSERRYSVTTLKRRSQAGSIVALVFILISSSFLLTLACAITETKSSLCTLNPPWIAVFSAVVAAFTISFFIMRCANELSFDLRIFKDLNAIDLLLILGTLFHPWTFFGTSFIEEEHMTWYFFWNTLMFFVLMRTLIVVVMYFSKKAMGATEVQEKPQLEQRMHGGISILPKWVLLIALHRYLRTMNQTGDRWLFLPDTADWLNAPENAVYLEAHLIVGTSLTVAICLWNLKYTNNIGKMHFGYTFAAATCIYLYRRVEMSPNYALPWSLDTVTIVSTFWGVLIIQMVCELLSYVGNFKLFNTGNFNLGVANNQFIYHKKKEKTEDYRFDDDEEPWNLNEVKLNLTRSISYLVLNNMMLIIALLMRPHNVIMIPSIYFTSAITLKCLQHDLLELKPGRNSEVLDVIGDTLAHIWIGMVFFFYQGNSNSLASVDLGAGYVGLGDYCPARVAARMGLHAYAGPAIAGAAYYCHLAAAARTWNGYLQSVWRSTNIFALQRIYTLVIYSLVATVFRHHLFVWTVFSPKLLYDFVGTIFTLQALLTIAEIIGVTHVTSWLSKIVGRKL